MKRVQVRIQTNIKQQGQSLEQVCEGKFFEREKGWNLVYQEQLGDDQRVSTTVKMQDGFVTIVRTGSTRMRQEYKLGQVTKGKYETPFGLMWMETKTEDIHWEEGRLFLSYRLNLNGEDLGRYEVALKLEGLG